MCLARCSAQCINNISEGGNTPETNYVCTCNYIPPPPPPPNTVTSVPVCHLQLWQQDLFSEFQSGCSETMALQNPHTITNENLRDRHRQNICAHSSVNVFVSVSKRDGHDPNNIKRI